MKFIHCLRIKGLWLVSLQRKPSPSDEQFVWCSFSGLASTYAIYRGEIGRLTHDTEFRTLPNVAPFEHINDDGPLSSVNYFVRSASIILAGFFHID